MKKKLTQLWKNKWNICENLQFPETLQSIEKAIDKVKPNLPSLQKETLLRDSEDHAHNFLPPLSYCEEVYQHLPPNWIAVYFQIGFCEFPSFLHCVSIASIHTNFSSLTNHALLTSIQGTGSQNWHSNSALLCIKITSTKEKDILLRILPMWSMKVIY